MPSSLKPAGISSFFESNPPKFQTETNQKPKEIPVRVHEVSAEEGQQYLIQAFQVMERL